MTTELRKPKVEGVDEHGTTFIEEDESMSYAVNHLRLRADLSDDMIEECFCIDPHVKISNYVLFKVAQFMVKAYPAWKKFVFENNDISRRQAMQKGIRHDVQGSGYPFMMSKTDPNAFELEHGLPVTVEDDVVRDHFQAKYLEKSSKFDGEEMLRRYRFSVVIAKLTEALYRRGYKLDENFGMKVRTVNKVEDRDGADGLTSEAYKEAQAYVAGAMKEAIKIAFKRDMYSFFSLNKAHDQYRFNMSDFQSYILSKCKPKEIRGELIHIFHHYDLIDVPAFREVVQEHTRKTEDRPLVLKYTQDTPLSESRGINALMPISASSGDAKADVDMKEASDETITIQEVEQFPDPNKPPPPDEPIIEDAEADDPMGTAGTTEPGGPNVMTVGKIAMVEKVSPAPFQPDPTYTPVTLTPAPGSSSHDEAPKAKPSYVEPKPKAHLTPRKSTEVKDEPMPERKPPSFVPAAAKTKLTTQVRSVPGKKAKTEATEATTNPAESAKASADVSTYTGNMGDPSNILDLRFQQMTCGAPTSRPPKLLQIHHQAPILQQTLEADRIRHLLLAHRERMRQRTKMRTNNLIKILEGKGANRLENRRGNLETD